jgi:acetylglutamate kinase
MKKLTIVKIGGKVVDDDKLLFELLKDFARIEGDKILVHGGGKIATDISNRLGVEPRMHEGRRITDKETLAVVTMVYGGLANKNIVAMLQAIACNALGVTGADLNLILSKKRSPEPIDFGFVGDVEKVNGKEIKNLVQLGYVPVFAALTHDGKGNILNTNADTIAQEVAVAMSEFYETDLVYTFEKKGVLHDPKDDNSYIPEITTAFYQQLLSDGIISDGMIPKMQNAYNALHRGVKSVKIVQAQNIATCGTPDFVGTNIIL